MALLPGTKVPVTHKVPSRVKVMLFAMVRFPVTFPGPSTLSSPMSTSPPPSTIPPASAIAFQSAIMVGVIGKSVVAVTSDVELTLPATAQLLVPAKLYFRFPSMVALSQLYVSTSPLTLTSLSVLPTPAITTESVIVAPESPKMSALENTLPIISESLCCISSPPQAGGQAMLGFPTCAPKLKEMSSEEKP